MAYEHLMYVCEYLMKIFWKYSWWTKKWKVGIWGKDKGPTGFNLNPKCWSFIILQIDSLSLKMVHVIAFENGLIMCCIDMEI